MCVCVFVGLLKYINGLLNSERKKLCVCMRVCVNNKRGTLKPGAVGHNHRAPLGRIDAHHHAKAPIAVGDVPQHSLRRLGIPATSDGGRDDILATLHLSGAVVDIVRYSALVLRHWPKQGKRLQGDAVDGEAIVAQTRDEAQCALWGRCRFEGVGESVSLGKNNLIGEMGGVCERNKL